MRAQVRDEPTVKGRHQGDEERHGEIIQVDGPDGAALSGQVAGRARQPVLPSSDSEIRHHSAS